MGCRKLQYYFSDGVSSGSAAHFEYSPLGKTTVASGNIPNRFAFRFSSEYHDSETNLVYYNYRYYSPDLGRWLSRDPIGEDAFFNNYILNQSSQEKLALYRQSLMPAYLFVGNNSIDNFDILGLAWYDWAPVVSPLVGLLSRYEGDTYTDYAHLAVHPSKCRKANCQERYILEKACEIRVNNYAFKKYVEALGLNTGRFGEDAALTGIAGGLVSWSSKDLAKAGAKLLAKKATAKTAGLTLAWVGLADIGLSLGNVVKQSLKFWNAKDKAIEEYCNCCH